ncbi:CDP-glycerol glycerophosphotransferase family protein [Streptomyces sp. NPDC059578]|uniref:bifunctional glycosyltransferase/CDP-glycerol:glycerophosphate glycerophosphotransferase n=1 Tax=unclassified Streptomyces TaxID=2593676 RepID=UPI00365765BA
MPRLTLVVPVYKVQGYLAECLDSIVRQDYTDFEIVAVDDCSPDASGAILDDYASRDDRIRVIHLTENVGLGRARNAGLAEARGDYILFLDSDDSLDPGSLSAIAHRLDATNEPDILVYDYVRTYWNGETRPNQRAGVLRDEGTDAVPLQDRPELLDLLQVVWNKAYRRDFVERLGLTFPHGYYEDVPWAFCSMIAAERIAVLDRVCVRYRQRREGGSITGTVSRKHFDVFEQYDRVFAFLDARPELDRLRPRLFRRMVDHFLNVLDKPGRLPRNARAEFFHRAAAAYAARIPTGFQRPAGSRGYKYAMLEHDAYSALAGATTAARTQRIVRSRARAAVKRSKRSAMGLYYQSQLRAPLDENLALFSAYWGRSVSCNPAAIAEELARLAPQVRRVWAVRADAVASVPAGVEVVRVGSREYWSALARAKYLVNNVNFTDALVKRDGQIHVQTHHGTPLKTMGLDQRKYPASSHGTDFTKLLERCDRWDYSLSSNRFSTTVWERVYPCSYVSLETGYPRNDVLVNGTAEDVARARAALGLADTTTAFLYMPTHREYQGEFRSRLDLARLADELGPDVTLLVRGHYFYSSSPQLADLRRSGRIVDVSGRHSVEDLYLAADALITDYSSAMFDYAVLDRPIVVFADDWDVYRAVRGTYFDLTEEPPGSVVRSEDALIDLLRSDAWRGAEAADLRAAFRRRFCEFDDGRAAERVVRRVFLGEQTPIPPVPFAERSHAPYPAQVLELVERA